MPRAVRAGALAVLAPWLRSPGCVAPRLLGRAAVVVLSAAPVREYLPKNGAATNGVLGCGKSPQYLPWAVFMYAPQIGAGTAPPGRAGAERMRRSFAWPTQTAVARRGVKPTNQASVKSSTVPVLPAAGQPICAAVPGARLDVLSRILVAS